MVDFENSQVYDDMYEIIVPIVRIVGGEFSSISVTILTRG